ncbi:MAG: hypothetical protein IK955_05810 [Clostridia bacterium]|nr:hypothetical protein [Clostridia bacterium]
MIYFRPIESISKAKRTLEEKTENFKPWFSVYEEGFYSKVCKNYVRIMYEDGRMMESSRLQNVCPNFHGIWFSYNDRQYLFGIFCLDFSLLLFLLGTVLFGMLIFDFEEAWFGFGVYITFFALNIKNIRVLREFLDML